MSDQSFNDKVIWNLIFSNFKGLYWGISLTNPLWSITEPKVDYERVSCYNEVAILKINDWQENTGWVFMADENDIVIWCSGSMGLTVSNTIEIKKPKIEEE